MDASTLFATYTGVLPAGEYFAQVNSFGGHLQQNLAHPEYNPANYFDMGNYFLTGTGFAAAVPEPTSFGLLAVGAISFLGRRRRSISVRVWGHCKHWAASGS